MEFGTSVRCPFVPREDDYPAECIILPINESTAIFGLSASLSQIAKSFEDCFKNFVLVPVLDFSFG